MCVQIDILQNYCREWNDHNLLKLNHEISCAYIIIFMVILFIQDKRQKKAEMMYKLRKNSLKMRIDCSKKQAPLRNLMDVTLNFPEGIFILDRILQSFLDSNRNSRFWLLSVCCIVKTHFFNELSILFLTTADPASCWFLSVQILSGYEMFGKGRTI